MLIMNISMNNDEDMQKMIKWYDIIEAPLFEQIRNPFSGLNLVMLKTKIIYGNPEKL